MARNRNQDKFRGAALGAAFMGLWYLALAIPGLAASEPLGGGKGVEKTVQGQQLRPATPRTETCQVKVECPPGSTAGKGVCQTAIDCPGGKPLVKTKKKTKTD